MAMLIHWDQEDEDFVLMALARNGMACLGAKFLAGLQQSTLNLGETWWLKHVVRVFHIFLFGDSFCWEDGCNNQYILIQVLISWEGVSSVTCSLDFTPCEGVSLRFFSGLSRGLNLYEVCILSKDL